MLLVSIAASTALYMAWILSDSTTLYGSRMVNYILLILFKIIMPMTVLVANMIVVREVRRASNNAAVNLGLQQHQQSTSSNSAVPTAMLITTSLVCILLWAISISPFLLVIEKLIHGTVWCSDTRGKTMYTVGELAVSLVSPGLFVMIYAYNFFVYVITGIQFRRELRQLSCCSSATAADNGNAVATLLLCETRNRPTSKAVFEIEDVCRTRLVD